MNKENYEKRQAELAAIRDRIRGAKLFNHKVLGFVYRLTDGSYIKPAEYRALVTQSLFWIFK